MPQALLAAGDCRVQFRNVKTVCFAPVRMSRPVLPCIAGSHADFWTRSISNLPKHQTSPCAIRLTGWLNHRDGYLLPGARAAYGATHVVQSSPVQSVWPDLHLSSSQCSYADVSVASVLQDMPNLTKNSVLIHIDPLQSAFKTVCIYVLYKYIGTSTQ